MTDTQQQSVHNRAELARQVLENPMYQRAMLEIRAAYVDALSNVKKGKHYEAKLTDIHDSLQNLNRIEQQLNRHLTSGKIEQIQKSRMFGG